MSVNDLIESLASAGESGQGIDFRAIRERIYEEHDRAITIEDRVKLIQVFNLVMDLVERNLERNGTAPNVIQEFRNARESDYRLLLVKESMVGENVCAETLAAVTQREVIGGRMAPDHTLYTMAQSKWRVPTRPVPSLSRLRCKSGPRQPQRRSSVRPAGVVRSGGCVGRREAKLPTDLKAFWKARVGPQQARRSLYILDRRTRAPI